MTNQLSLVLQPASRVSTILPCALIVATLLFGCASSATAPNAPVVTEAIDVGSITALAYRDGAIYLSRSHHSGCVVEQHRPESEDASPAIVTELGTCPDRIDLGVEDDLLFEGSHGPLIAGGTDRDLPEGETYLSRVSAQNYVTRNANRLVWYRDGTEATAEGSWNGPAKILDREGAVVAVRAESEGDRLIRLGWPEDGTRLVETVLTDPLERIAAIEPDEDQKELAITALRDGSYDIAITNAEEQFTNWVPPDPADEVNPRWSPVGYKLSYIIRNRGGDILRTVHVPTAAMVLLDFPDSTIIDYTWLPDGERVVVALSSLLESDKIVEAHYSGSARKVVVEPRYRFARQIERLPDTPPGSALAMPEPVRYGDGHPLVIWASEGSARGAGFNPDLIPLLERPGLGLVVVNGTTAELGPSFWNEIGGLRWVDGANVWLVGPGGGGEDLPESVQRIDDAGIETARWLVQQIEEGRADQ